MAAIHNFSLDQGSTFAITVTIRDNAGDPLDLTAYTARGQIRKTYQSENATNFEIQILSPPDTGKLTLALDADVTEGLAAGRYVYDVEIVNGTVVNRVLQGQITVDPEVTRS